MTEAEFNQSEDPDRLVKWLLNSGRLSQRKARLLAVACFRRVEHLLSRGGWQKSIAAIHAWEQYADGLVGEDEIRQAHSFACSDAMSAGHSIAHPGDVNYYAASAAAEAVEFAAVFPRAMKSAARAIAEGGHEIERTLW